MDEKATKMKDATRGDDATYVTAEVMVRTNPSINAATMTRFSRKAAYCGLCMGRGERDRETERQSERDRERERDGERERQRQRVSMHHR